MPLRPWVAMTCVLPMVGCMAATGSSPPPPSASAASPAAITFAVEGDEPVIDPADYGAAYLLPGATVVHDGTAHLWAVAFFPDPADEPRVLHLASDDGVAWSGDPDASAMEGFALELDEPGPIPSAAFIGGDGTWIMVGGGRLPGGTRPVLWRATAPGPEGPWTADAAPILEPSATDWDTAIVDHPSVLPTADGFLMAYGGAAAAAPNRNRIGLATSADGRTWTRVPATLDGGDDREALGPDACGIDARTMVEPHLLATEGGQLLVFGVMAEGSDGDLQILTATSTDGRTWTCASGADAFGADDLGGRHMHSFAVIEQPDGPPSLLLEILGDDHSTLWLARSTVHPSIAAP